MKKYLHLKKDVVTISKLKQWELCMDSKRFLSSGEPNATKSITIEEYNQMPDRLGSSAIRSFLDSPNVFFNTVVCQGEKEESDALRIGEFLHTGILEPELIKTRYVVMPEFWGLTQKGERTNSGSCKEVKQQKAKWLLDQDPKAKVVSEAELKMLNSILVNLQRHKQAVNIVTHGKPEETFIFTDPITGLKLKTRPDFLSFGGVWLTELKSTKCSKQQIFGADAFKRRYDVQIATQEMGLKICRNIEPRRKMILAIEKNTYEVAIFYFEDDDLYPGRQDLRKALDGIALCIEKDEWPMRQTSMQRIHIPNYFINEVTEEEEEIANAN